MSNHTKEPWLCDKRTGHTLNPQTASTVQGGVVSPQVRCDNCNTVVTQGEAKTLFCSGEINGVPRHVISLCPSCVPTKKRRKFGMKTNHNNAVSELVTAPTREQSVLGWAIHCDLIDSRDIDQEFVKSILENLREFSDLAYAAGQAAEREACAKVCDEIESQNFDTNEGGYARDCADAIRARGKAEGQTDYPDEIYLSPENGCEFVYLKGGVEIGRRRATPWEVRAFMRMPRGDK